MKAKNINGTSDNTCTCPSWLEHWKKFGGKTIPATCVVTGCPKAPEVGAHVQKDSATDKHWYIIPVCKAHNAKTSELAVKENTFFAPANVSETCGKKN